MHCLQTELCEEQNGKTGLPCAEKLIPDSALTHRTQPAVVAVSRFFVFPLSNDLTWQICAGAFFTRDIHWLRTKALQLLSEHDWCLSRGIPRGFQEQLRLVSSILDKISRYHV